MKSLVLFALASTFSIAALAVDPIVDIHFASEAIKSIDAFKLSDTDQAKLNWALERLNFATNNLNNGYHEGQSTGGDYAACVTAVDQGTHLSGAAAADFCEHDSSQAAIVCVLKLDKTSMPTSQIADACLRHSSH